MKRRFILSLVGVAVLVLLQFPIVGADQLFHSERLDFWLTAAGKIAEHPKLRSGHVVDIHPNGPVNGALERYMINGAAPNSSYQVVLQVFSNVGCREDTSLPSISTALLKTNAQGNAHGQWNFSAADISGFSGFVGGVFWTLVDEDDVVAYRTDCIVVSVD